MVATLGIIASAKQNTASLAKRGSAVIGTPVGTAWTVTANAVDGAVGSTPATYALWTNSTSSAVGSIEIGTYDFSTVPAGATNITIQATQRGMVNSTGRVTSISMQVYDGATLIGSATAITPVTVAANTVSAAIPLTRAQLVSSTFKVRVTVTHAANTQQLIYNLDHIDVTATYTP